ncbi:DUF4234 domain-containing protein [Hoyosella altamirensis]|uniref:DUF4234 domain-containing protein n=1 Tax=Hoyosella altamirensis TaxID=616997 RepID=A0A839RN74_9ACTN|nr:DUF4234 domain-containing protein [Hoyosella altamirensis]MBB3038422.1 hypothetical protein [Hoyosella altamirensis]
MTIETAPIRKQGAWGLWWLCMITFGIYYLVWFDRINTELATVTGSERAAWTRWWSQLIPFYGLIALSRTAKRLNAAHSQAGSSVRVSPVMTWLWSGLWFLSTPRYVQRRINTLAEITSARNVEAATRAAA